MLVVNCTHHYPIIGAKCVGSLSDPILCTVLQLTKVTPPAGDGNINDEDLDADVKVALTENEAEIRSYLIDNEPLSEETIEKFANIFWNNEPYRYICLGCIYTHTIDTGL